jgi:hypothetical protein
LLRRHLAVHRDARPQLTVVARALAAGPRERVDPALQVLRELACEGAAVSVSVFLVQVGGP